MDSGPNGAQRSRMVRRQVLRTTVGSVGYLTLLLSMLPPVLAFTAPGGEALGRLQHLVGIILWIPPVALAWLLHRHQKTILRRRLLEEALCPKCFYDLTGNVSGICPECGTAFRWEDVKPKTEVQSPKVED
jgi:hypothetical protein